MQWRHYNLGNDGDWVFLGGTNEADLWVSKGGTLCCQYADDEEEWVSYAPADTLWRHVIGEITLDDGNDSTSTEGWYGDSTVVEYHDPKPIAHYLSIFAPHVFSDAVRDKIYNSLKGEEHGTKA